MKTDTQLEDPLVFQLRQAFGQFIRVTNATHTLARRSIECAGVCGRLLDEALTECKRTKTPFPEWLERNQICYKDKVLQERTAYRLIKLSNALTHMSELLECPSLNQAYIAAGIVPEPEQGNKETHNPGYIFYAQKLAQYFNVNSKNVDSLDAEQRKSIAVSLEPIVAFYRRLTGRL